MNILLDALAVVFIVVMLRIAHKDGMARLRKLTGQDKEDR